MWGRGQAGSWGKTRTQAGLDPKVVPTLLERAGGSLLRWTSGSLKREMRVPAPPPGSLENVHGDLLRSLWTDSDLACISERYTQGFVHPAPYASPKHSSVSVWVHVDYGTDVRR